MCGEAENPSRILSLQHRSPLGGGQHRVSGWPGAPQKGYPASLRDPPVSGSSGLGLQGWPPPPLLHGFQRTNSGPHGDRALYPMSCLPGPWLRLLWTVKSKKNFTMMVTGTSGLGIWSSSLSLTLLWPKVRQRTSIQNFVDEHWCQ